MAVLLQSMFGNSRTQGCGQVSPTLGDPTALYKEDLPGPGQLIQTQLPFSCQKGPLLTAQNPFTSALDSLHSILPQTEKGNVETLLDEALAYIQRLQHRTQQLGSDLPHAFQTTLFPLDPVDKALESLSQLIPAPPPLRPAPQGPHVTFMPQVVTLQQCWSRLLTLLWSFSTEHRN
ncbi:TPA: hypothetical protein ACH3X1_002312 [Trebouxia sp. C0004]